MTDEAAMKQSVVRNLGESGDAHTVTLLYIIYRTIEANPRITVARLKTLLQQEYFLTDKDIDSGLAGLVSPSLFNVVSRWRNPKRPIEDTVLTVRENNPEFSDWIKTQLGEYQELAVIRPPIFVYRKTEQGVAG